MGSSTWYMIRRCCTCGWITRLFRISSVSPTPHPTPSPTTSPFPYQHWKADLGAAADVFYRPVCTLMQYLFASGHFGTRLPSERLRWPRGLNWLSGTCCLLRKMLRFENVAKNPTFLENSKFASWKGKILWKCKDHLNVGLNATGPPYKPFQRSENEHSCPQKNVTS